MATRRQFLQIGSAAGAGLFLYYRNGLPRVFAAAIPGGTLDPTSVPKYSTPLLIPPVMPRAGTIKLKGRQDRRLLRDLDEAVHAADPAGRPAGDDRLGLRRGEVAPARAACCSTTRPRSRSRRSGTGRCG